jgi:hypothetical protein
MAQEFAYHCMTPELVSAGEKLTAQATRLVQAYEVPESEVLEADTNGRFKANDVVWTKGRKAACESFSQ